MTEDGASLWTKQQIGHLIRSDEGLTLETSAFQLVAVANLHFQRSWYNQITILLNIALAKLDL